MFLFDSVVKNAIVVTASDEIRCDIGIKDGVVKVLGQGLPVDTSTVVIDAEGAYVTVSAFHFDPLPKAASSDFSARY